jgi:hypothetical protein
MCRATRFFPAFSGLLVLALVVWAGPVRPVAAADTEILEIAGKTGVHVFSVELAKTDADRSRGLMHRKSLPAGRGMLFDFERDQMVTMWTRNTYISLSQAAVGRAAAARARVASMHGTMMSRSTRCSIAARCGELSRP